MIYIAEQKSRKTVGKTSLFLCFNYNEDIIQIIKQAGDALWHKDIKQWELPCNKLSFLIENLSLIDDIDLELQEDETTQELELIQDYRTKPFDYQLEGIKWLLNNKNCLLLDEPGLGKTLQVIYFAEELKARENIEHCLIICGVNSLKINWEKEIQKHSKLDCVVIGKQITKRGIIKYASIKERAEQLFNSIKEFFVILNVESLRDNLIVDAIRNSKNDFNVIIIDEIHCCKSPVSLQGKNLLKLRKIGDRHIGMTGTLIVNNPLDSYTPLKFIGRENSTYTNYKQFYCIYEQKFGHNQIVGYKNLEILKDEINECSLRRKKDLLDLPPKVIIPEYIEMDEKHQKFYKDLESGIIEEADKVSIKNSSLLGMVVRLRQASTCPEVLTSADFTNSKLERAKSLIDEIISNNEKVVVFSEFKAPLYDLKEMIKEYNPVVCTGDQPDDEVGQIIDVFQTNNKCKVLLATAQKLGTGFTLTAASYAIFLDSDWTPAIETQVEDRIHRIGASKTVMIYKLICKDTIDERVQQVLERKKVISDYLIDDKETERDDLKELLGLK